MEMVVAGRHRLPLLNNKDRGQAERIFQPCIPADRLSEY
jgi:hypothetical protein